MSAVIASRHKRYLRKQTRCSLSPVPFAVKDCFSFRVMSHRFTRVLKVRLFYTTNDNFTHAPARTFFIKSLSRLLMHSLITFKQKRPDATPG